MHFALAIFCLQLSSALVCRPFVRACLFQSSNRQRLAELVSSAATDESRHALLETEAAVELAAQAAMACQWDQCALHAPADVADPGLILSHSEPCIRPCFNASGICLRSPAGKRHMACKQP